MLSLHSNNYQDYSNKLVSTACTFKVANPKGVLIHLNETGVQVMS